MTTSLKKKKLSLRQKIYLFVIVAGFMYILCPYVAYADVFGASVPDLYADITENVEEVNELLSKAFEISQDSPYDLLGHFNKGLCSAVHIASRDAALVIATLLLMVDFFRKSIHFEWSSRWENILVFLVKVIAIKQIVQNTDVIVAHIYDLCDYINQKATNWGTDVQLLPCDDANDYNVTYIKDEILQAAMPWWSVFKKITGTDSDGTQYRISMKAVHMFYPKAKAPSSWAWSEFSTQLMGKDSPNGKVVFNTTLERCFLTPYFLFMKLIAYYIFVIVIGRAFELCVYTILAPLPMATFASEVASDTAKNFIRNYMACALQMVVIITFFITYSSMVTYYMTNYSMTHTKMFHIIMLASLAVAISKSGEWSRRLTGAC